MQALSYSLKYLIGDLDIFDEIKNEGARVING